MPKRSAQQTNNKRKKQKISLSGSNLRIFRYKDDKNNWSSWENLSKAEQKGKKKETDSIVHRFNRIIGFYLDNDEQLHNNVYLQEVRDRVKDIVRFPKSELSRTNCQANFENFILANNPATNPYVQFLKSLQNPDPKRVYKIKYEPPPPDLINAYVLYCSDPEDVKTGNLYGRNNVYNSVKTYVGAISGTSRQFGAGKLEHRSDTQDLLKILSDTNNPKRAAVVHLERDFEKLHEACFNTRIFINYRRRVAIWTRFLVQFAIIGRSSDVTQNCPLIENMQFPEHENDYLPDGTPRYVTVIMTHWKSRPKWHKEQIPEYRLRIYANHVDSRFCPLTWLFIHWDLENLSTGPIVATKSQSTYRTSIKKLFEHCGFECTSHSLRRSAAQWARRCGADWTTIRNVGRWVSYINVLIYIADGEAHARVAIRNNNGIDPVLSYWIFDSDTMVDTMDKGADPVNI